jgi:hypothetical protein
MLPKRQLRASQKQRSAESKQSDEKVGPLVAGVEQILLSGIYG